MHCHRLMSIPRITNRIARQMQFNIYLEMAQG